MLQDNEAQLKTALTGRQLSHVQIQQRINSFKQVVLDSIDALRGDWQVHKSSKNDAALITQSEAYLRHYERESGLWTKMQQPIPEKHQLIDVIALLRTQVYSIQ